MSKFDECIRSKDNDFCFFHNCGATDPEQCGKADCPHCACKIKPEKLQFTNSYLRAKDRGEVA